MLTIRYRCCFNAMAYPKNDNGWLQGTNLGQIQKEMPGCMPQNATASLFPGQISPNRANEVDCGVFME
jgi:hypothetical protein